MKNIITALLLLAFIAGCGQKKKEPTVQELLIKIEKDSIRNKKLEDHVKKIDKNVDSILSSKPLTIDQLQKVLRTKIR